MAPTTYKRNLTPIIFPIRQIAMHLMRSEATTNVNCAGSSIALTSSNAAPVSDWLRMRHAVACPLNSMLPVFISQADHLSSSRLASSSLRRSTISAETAGLSASAMGVPSCFFYLLTFDIHWKIFGP
jgi:hypothetical protein